MHSNETRSRLLLTHGRAAAGLVATALRRAPENPSAGSKRDAAALEPAGEATGGEDARGRERRAVVGVPVAGVDDLAVPGRSPRLQGSPQTSQVSATRKCTRQPSGRASTRLARSSTASSTPSRSSTGSISSWNPDETTSGCRARASAAKPGRTRACSTTCAHDLVERGRDRRELGRDHVVQRHPAGVELGLGALVDLGVAELRQHEVERVPLGHRAVEVEHQPHAATLAAECLRSGGEVRAAGAVRRHEGSRRFGPPLGHAGLDHDRAGDDQLALPLVPVGVAQDEHERPARNRAAASSRLRAGGSSRRRAARRARGRTRRPRSTARPGARPRADPRRRQGRPRRAAPAGRPRHRPHDLGPPRRRPGRELADVRRRGLRASRLGHRSDDRRVDALDLLRRQRRAEAERVRAGRQRAHGRALDSPGPPAPCISSASVITTPSKPSSVRNSSTTARVPGRRLVAEGAEADVRGHHRAHAGLDRSRERRQRALAQDVEARVGRRQLEVRVGDRLAVAGEVLGAGRDADAAASPRRTPRPGARRAAGSEPNERTPTIALAGSTSTSATGARSRSIPTAASSPPIAAPTRRVSVRVVDRAEREVPGNELPLAASSRVTSPPSSSVATINSGRSARSEAVSAATCSGSRMFCAKSTTPPSPRPAAASASREPSRRRTPEGGRPGRAARSSADRAGRQPERDLPLHEQEEDDRPGSRSASSPPSAPPQSVLRLVP